MKLGKHACDLWRLMVLCDWIEHSRHLSLNTATKRVKAGNTNCSEWQNKRTIERKRRGMEERGIEGRKVWKKTKQLKIFADEATTTVTHLTCHRFGGNAWQIPARGSGFLWRHTIWKAGPAVSDWPAIYVSSLVPCIWIRQFHRRLGTSAPNCTASLHTLHLSLSWMKLCFSKMLLV